MQTHRSGSSGLAAVVASPRVAAAAAAAQARPSRVRARTLVWWHNATTAPLGSVRRSPTNSRSATRRHVDVLPLQNEQFTTKIPVALQSDSPPDLFQQWGGGELADAVRPASSRT